MQRRRLQMETLDPRQLLTSIVSEPLTVSDGAPSDGQSAAFSINGDGTDEFELAVLPRLACESVTYRPSRITPQSTIPGVQSAVVAGPTDPKIDSENGRIKVQFYWDRGGAVDDRSSCWIRVSHAHADQGFGHLTLPASDHEVIVDFVEGDLHWPIIIGRLFNSVDTHPIDLPGENHTGIKSNGMPDGGGRNEVVLDDTKGSEGIRVHAQFDMDSTIENDAHEQQLPDVTQEVTNRETINIANELFPTNQTRE